MDRLNYNTAKLFLNQSTHIIIPLFLLYSSSRLLLKSDIFLNLWRAAPALNTIDGLGDNAAVAIAEAAKDGIFLSKDDFRERTKVSKTTIELMSDLGLFGDMPESNQLSLFDFGA